MPGWMSATTWPSKSFSRFISTATGIASRPEWPRRKLSGKTMKLDSETKKRLIEAMAETLIGHAVELTDLDRAIGDGDHGLNMKRGFEAVLADRDNLAAKPLPDMLKALGTHLVMTIGGASGPLYGTLFMALGKEIPAEPSLPDVARAFAAAVAAVKSRGKSTVGEKTMLDVL